MLLLPVPFLSMQQPLLLLQLQPKWKRIKVQPDKYKNSDLLVAYTSIAKAASDDKYTALSLDLKHALAKLTIEVNATAIDNPVIKSVTIKDAIADYTVVYNGSDVTPATTTVSGSNKVNIKPLADRSVFSAVLPGYRPFRM